MAVTSSTGCAGNNAVGKGAGILEVEYQNQLRAADPFSI